ncbi:response regulator [Hansschlegelia beijingensis]|uniref:response regulator n=1 Tax=Hansschlegelia beijingensis TaxID=1133344 RepID=UPI00387F01F5
MSGLFAERHVLLVEDDFLLAREMKRALEARGAVVLGPVAQDREAARLIKAAARLDFALLDLDLDGRSVAPIAMALRERGVRMVVVTGCDVTALPAPLQDVPVCQKPATIEQIETALSRIG